SGAPPRESFPRAGARPSPSPGESGALRPAPVPRGRARPAPASAWRSGCGGSSRPDRSDGLRAQHALHGEHEALPALGFLLQLRPAGAGEAVIARPAVVLRRAPLGRDPAAVLEAAQGRIE